MSSGANRQSGTASEAAPAEKRASDTAAPFAQVVIAMSALAMLPRLWKRGAQCGHPDCQLVLCRYPEPAPQPPAPLPRPPPPRATSLQATASPAAAWWGAMGDQGAGGRAPRAPPCGARPFALRARLLSLAARPRGSPRAERRIVSPWRGEGAADGRGGKATGGPFRAKTATDTLGVFARRVTPGHYWCNDVLGGLLQRNTSVCVCVCVCVCLFCC